MSWIEFRNTFRERWWRAARRHSRHQKTEPISGRCAAVAFSLTVVLAISLAFILLRVAAHSTTGSDAVFNTVLSAAFLLGPGTLIATFYDRTWWTREKRSWIFGFNFLPLSLALPLAGAIKVFWLTGP